MPEVKNDVKLAYWICPCGKETVQPIGPDVKMVEICPDCKRPHDRIREADGSFTDFITAPEWFNEEWLAHMKKLGDAEMNFRQAAFQECEQNRKKMESQQLMKERQKHSQNVVAGGVRRLKLHKRKGIDWAYNSVIKKFIGRPFPPQMKEAK